MASLWTPAPPFLKEIPYYADTWAPCMPNLCAYFSGDYHCHTPAARPQIGHDLWVCLRLRLHLRLQLQSGAAVALA